jgi:hypothetical protein
MLRMETSEPLPDAASIRKTAKNLHRALEPFGDGQQIPPMQEIRSALNWLEHINGPASKVDNRKHVAAVHANGLVNEFSQKPPNSGNQVRDVAGLLYEALTGEEGAELKRQVATEHRSWSGVDRLRGRGR